METADRRRLEEAEAALYSLIHHDFRDHGLFIHTDFAQVDKTRSRIILEVQKELLVSFPRSASDLRLIEDFIRSPEYERVGRSSIVKKGLCLEESFAQFAVPLPHLDFLISEFCSSIVKILATQEHPDFKTNSEFFLKYIHKRDDGFFSVVRVQGEWHLYAVNSGQYISGQITEELAEKLIELSRPAERSVRGD